MPKTYYTSPLGVAKFPWITTADTKFNADGLFHVVLDMEPGKDTEEMVKRVQEAAQAAFDEITSDMTPAEKKRWRLYVPVKRQEDDEGHETGHWEATFRQNRVIKFANGDTKEITIAVKDAKNKDMVKPVWGGSTIRVSYAMRPIKLASSKEAGVRLDFAAVQVKELRTAGQGRRFEDLDEGYVDERDQAAFDPGDDRPVHGDY